MVFDCLAILPYHFYPLEEVVGLESCCEDYDVGFYEAL